MAVTSPPPSLAAIVFRTIWGNIVLFFTTLFFGSLGTLLGWIPPRGTVMYWCARMWSHAVLWASGIRLRVSGTAELGRASYVYMANHQSMYDIPVLIATLPGETRFLAKRELFRIPIFGWALWVGGFVPVDRGDRSRSRDTMAAAADRLRRGHSLLIFPEETRSRDGRLLPFKSGGFLLALNARVPVVPVGIEGTFEIQRKGSWVIHPRVVDVRYGTPLEVTEASSRERKALVSGVRQAIAELARTTFTEGEKPAVEAVPSPSPPPAAAGPPPSAG